MTPFTGGEVNAYFEYSKGGLLGKLIFVGEALLLEREKLAVEKIELSDRQKIEGTTSDPRQLWSKVKILVLGFVLFCQLWFEEPDKETHQSET